MIPLTRFCRLFVAVGTLLGVASGISQTAVEGGTGPAKAIRAIIDEYENTVRANTQKIIDAKTEEEKNRYRGTVPTVAPYATRVMKIIQEQPADPSVAPAVSWLVTQAAGFPEGQSALQMIGTVHVASAGIAQAVKALEYYPLPVAEPLLTAVREKNPNAEEKAAATYALGVQYFRLFENAPAQKEADAAKSKSMDYFQEVTSKYGSATIQGFPIAEQASRMMFEMSNLALGCEAPDIDGKDVDGTPFKLSEYRGKKVLLIFWGGWCHACHGVLPLVNQFATEMQNKSVVVLGVNTDIPDEARKAYQQYQVNFRNWSDGTTGGPITTLFNLRNFPTLYLLDEKGVILLKNTSMEAVKELLAKGK
jgi:peroxiredoxin